MESLVQTPEGSVTNVCRDGEISETVVATVAEAKGVDPLELDPLYDTVDPDALNSIFRPSVGSPSPSTELSFSVAGCHVVVRGDGEVTASPRTEDAERSAAIAAGDD